jgi:spore germination protein YaaH
MLQPFWLWLNQHRKMMGMGFLLFGVFVASACAVIWLFRDNPLLSPITSSTTLQFLSDKLTKANKSNSPKMIYGFLPYWNVNRVVIQPELTQLAYFSLTFDHTGHIISRQDGEVDQGYHKLQSDDFVNSMQAAQKNHTQLEIVLAQFNNDEISAFLLSPSSQQQLLTELNSILLEYPFTGVNIDIEYTGPVTTNLQDDLATFMHNLNNNLKQRRQGVNLSIDIYSSSGDNNDLWNLPKIAPNVDEVVVMAYDFHRRSSPLAGPVAPLFGGQVLWDSDITSHLKTILTSVPADKLLLGVPFYGYEWQTTSREAQATTLPETGSTASFDYVQSILSQKTELKVQEGWSEEALSPYLSYVKNHKTYIIYYENSRSLSYKLDLVNQLELRGIAIWALGYEKDSRELWDTIKNKF